MARKKSEPAPEVQTVVRALALPVACALTPEGVRCDWKEVAPVLQAAWLSATDLAKWGVLQCCALELKTKQPGRGPCPKLGLYTAGVKNKRYPQWRDWAGRTGCAADVLWAVERKWRRERQGSLALHDERIFSPRFPQPYPVRRQEWRAEQTPDGRMRVGVTLPGGRLWLQLRGGPEFGRQVGAFRRIVSGELDAGQLLIYRINASDHRRVGCVDEKPAGGGNSVRYQTMVKICYSIVPERRKGHTMLLKRDPECMWVAETRGREWVLNEDWHRRMTARLAEVARLHRDFRGRNSDGVQRSAEDWKAERRAGRPAIRHRQLCAARATKYDRRMLSVCQQAAAAVAGFAARQGVSSILYLKEGLEGNYLWSKADQALDDRCKAAGIALIGGKDVSD